MTLHFRHRNCLISFCSVCAELETWPPLYVPCSPPDNSRWKVHNVLE